VNGDRLATTALYCIEWKNHRRQPKMIDGIKECWANLDINATDADGEKLQHSHHQLPADGNNSVFWIRIRKCCAYRANVSTTDQRASGQTTDATAYAAVSCV